MVENQAAGAPWAEDHLTPHQIAEKLCLSVDTVRGIFSEMPNVVKIQRPRSNKAARPYITLRIPVRTFEEWYRLNTAGFGERKRGGRKV